MSLVSSRLAIANALVALVAGIQNPATSTALYQEVKLGSVFDPTGFTSWAEVTHFQGQGGPEGSGGNQVGWRINDEITFQITSGFGPYETDSTAAETAMLTAQDIVLPSLRQHFQLPDASNPTNAVQSVYRVLVQSVDRSHVVRFPNGHTYRLWMVQVLVSQQYNITLVQP